MVLNGICTLELCILIELGIMVISWSIIYHSYGGGSIMALTKITGGDGIKDGSIKEADLNIDNTPTNDYVLTAKSSAAGVLLLHGLKVGLVLKVVGRTKFFGRMGQQ